MLFDRPVQSIHIPAGSQKPDLGPTWNDVGEIPELKRDMLLRLAACLMCELLDASLESFASQKSNVIHHEF